MIVTAFRVSTAAWAVAGSFGLLIWMPADGVPCIWCGTLNEPPLMVIVPGALPTTMCPKSAQLVNVIGPDQDSTRLTKWNVELLTATYPLPMTGESDSKSIPGPAELTTLTWFMVRP